MYSVRRWRAESKCPSFISHCFPPLLVLGTKVWLPKYVLLIHMDPVEAAFTHPNLLSFLPNFLQGLVYFEAEVNANCSVPGFPTVILPGFTGLLFWVYTRYLIHAFRVTGQQGRIILPSTTVGHTRNSRVHMYFILS